LQTDFFKIRFTAIPIFLDELLASHATIQDRDDRTPLVVI